MRLNIFSISKENLSLLRTKLAGIGMTIIHSEDQAGWHGEFFYSNSPQPGEIEWVDTFASYFDELPQPKNLNYFAIYLFTKNDVTYAISYGKSHFYLRQFCDHDFGVEMAKRIANEFDIRQTSSKRFAGKRRKDIKSFTNNTRLDVESGESIDYLQAALLSDRQEDFGKSGKFGSSALLSPDIVPSEIGSFLNKVDAELIKDPLFQLPRTTIIPEGAESKKYDDLLVKELMSGASDSEFTDNSYDLYGVDFVFPNGGKYRVYAPLYDDFKTDKLTIEDLRFYIADQHITKDHVLGIKIAFELEGQRKFTRGLKECLDYIVHDENIILSNGKWMSFNQDYIDFLDEYLATITIEDPEADFLEIDQKEGDFNASKLVADHGYVNADKDFSKVKIKTGNPVEAWDLHKGESVYAVKFGPAQKLSYVCDQASAVLELIRNRASVKKIPNFKNYVLWLGYETASKRMDSITKSRSLILKQKIESWARRSRDLGIEPVIKISRKVSSKN